MLFNKNIGRKNITIHTITIIVVKKHHALAVLMQSNVTLMFVDFVNYAALIR